MKLIKFIGKPWLIPIALQSRGFGWIIPDSIFLQCAYRSAFGKKLDLKNPITFNEKLQWLKLYDRDPQYTKLVDKYEAKQYVAEKIGKEHVIPTLGVWDRFDDIDFHRLPNQFVLKTTHDSGGVVIVKEKSKFDKNVAREKIEKSLNNNFFWNGREWPYKNVRPRIIAEEYIFTKESENIRDYKLFCFNGEPKLALVCSERFSEQGLKEDFFDNNWIRLPIKRPNIPNLRSKIDRPINFELMKQLAKVLSRDIPFLRIDFYETNGKVLFGEMTFFPASGFSGFEPEQWDYKLGEWIKLPNYVESSNLNRK